MRLGAVPRQPASQAPRQGRPCPAREPPAGGRAVPWRRSPRQRDHDGRGSETHRLDLDEAGGPRPRPGALPRRPLRAHPGKPRRSGAAARARWATSRPPATHAPSTYKIPVPSECRRSSTCSWRRAPTVAPADACDLGVLGEPRRAAFAAAKPAGAARCAGRARSHPDGGTSMRH